jgi:hypothetical protein
MNSSVPVSVSCACVLFFLFLQAGAAESAELTAYSEVVRKEVRRGDHKVTLIRVRPPTLSKVIRTPVAAPRPLTSEEKAYEERVAQKGYAMLSLSATVYLSAKTAVTELRWRNESGEIEYRAWSNVDFRYLTNLTQIETETTVYSWFPFIDECDLSGWPKNEKPPVPPDLGFSRSEAEYFVDAHAKDLKSEEATLAGLDYLHAYYQLNYSELKTAYEKRLADARAEEIRLARNPPKTPDTTTYFWPIQSRRNPR